ncbi:MAG: galactose mutarotase [Sphingomonadales bacterium]|nr:galactose mutarotase [Sphingomonadales bacterium]
MTGQRARLGFAVAAALLPAAASANAEPSRRRFGTLPDGTAIEAITLANHHGMAVTVITLGASLQAVIVPDAKGHRDDVLLGYADVAGYLARRQFMGATVGRVANRIAGGGFLLDSRRYRITRNDGANALHGGAAGFDQAVWQVARVHEGRDGEDVALRHVSRDGDQGFPGTVVATVRYRLDEHSRLTITCGATSDRPTVVALSNHAYWNLAGEGSRFSAMDQRLTIPAARYLPVDASLIPTGELRKVAGTPFDFRRPRAIGQRVRDGDDEQIRVGRGYDHNWVLARAPTPDVHPMARVSDPHSGRAMELWSNQPGLQFYSGNFLDGTSRGKAGGLYREGDAIVLEPQAFPDTVNHPGFGSIRLDRGQRYRNTIVYRFFNGR